MAPFSKNKRGRGGFSSRGRGRGGARGRGTNKNTFYSTRVEEVNPEESEPPSASDEEIQDDVMSSSEGSDEDGDIDSAVVKPYSMLMQTLSASSTKDEQPARKKRRLSGNGAYQTDDTAEKPYAVEEPDAGVVVDGEEAVDEVDEKDELDDTTPTVPDEDDVVDDDDEDDDDEDDEEIDDKSDPYKTHFSDLSSDRIALAVKDVQASSWTMRKSVSKGWKQVWNLPSTLEAQDQDKSQLRSTRDMKLKQKLKDRAESVIPQLSGEMSLVASPIYNYQDVLFCDRTTKNVPQLRSLTALHALNHVLKTRDRVLKNNLKAAKTEADDVEYRDQGFTRPKVLFVLPTKQACVKVVDSILSLYEPEQQENKKRFQEGYSRTDEPSAQDQPEDFVELFEGNDDDMFRIGLKFTRKTCKFFAGFYNSDIIFASPLGLRMAISPEGSKKQDFDFLSSIEVVVVDHADAMLMQNWEHVEFGFDNMNQQPKEAHGCDFGRVRNWYLDGHAKYLRQTIVMSSFNTPEINKLYSRVMSNIAGKVKISRESYNGTISELGVQLKQTFTRFDSSSPATEPDARFNFFRSNILPMLDRSSRGGSGRGLGILLFIPSYMDFVRVRNFLANSSAAQNISYGLISEYTDRKETARARSHFITGRHSVLLYTGRAHHFRRYRIRGCKKIIFYALPENPIFYKEVAGEYLAKSISEGIVDPNDATSRALFSRWDALKLERIVGSARLGAMIKEKGGDTFDFL